MALYQISGIGCSDCGTCNNGVKDAFGQIELDSIGRRSKAERRSRRRARRNRRRYGENCKGRTGAKIALSVARRAYLLMLRLNIKKMAVKMNAVLSNPETRLKAIEKWCRLGGNAKLLKRTTEKAYAKYKRKHKVSGYDDLGFIGLAPAAIIAQALPVLKALAPLLKAVTPLLKKSGEIEETETGEIEETETSSESTSDSSSESVSDTIEGLSGSNILLIGAGLVGAYYLLKKKK